jgi:ABC-type antimicrobial peptide transport system permease subunit
VVSLVGFLIGIGGVAGVTLFSKQTAMPLVVSSEVIALLLMTTVAIGAISALSVITKVLRIDPVTVFAEKNT